MISFHSTQNGLACVISSDPYLLGSNTLGGKSWNFLVPVRCSMLASLTYKFIYSNCINENNRSSNFTATQEQSGLIEMEHPLGTRTIQGSLKEEATLSLLQQGCSLLHYIRMPTII